MKIIIFLLSFIFALESFADDNLNFQLTQAAAKDNLKLTIELLDKGADPLSYAPWQGYPIAPAMHLAALASAEKGTDQVYQEFLRRGVKPNAIGSYPPSLGGGIGETVWDYLMSNMQDDSYQQKFENFFLRSLQEGADVFVKGPYTWTFSRLIFQKHERVVAELIKRGVSRESWVWFTNEWTNWYYRGQTNPEVRAELFRFFRKYEPLIKVEKIGIDQWGKYKFENSQLTYLMPASFLFVDYAGHHVDEEFLSEFKNIGFDMNQKFGSTSTCEKADAPSVGDVNSLLRLGCQPSIKWVLNALLRNDYTMAEKLLSQGFDINQIFSGRYDRGTLLTEICSSGSDVKNNQKILWLLKKGANPNIASESGKLCLNLAIGKFDSAPQIQNSFDLLKILISYQADVNSIMSGKYRPLSMLGNMMSGTTVTDPMRDLILQAVRLLLNAGADPNLVGKDPEYTNQVPLMNFSGSSYSQSTAAAELLLDHGADPYLMTDRWASPIHLLALSCSNVLCDKVINKILKKAPALLNRKQAIWYDNQTPLCYSVMSDNAITADVLLNLKADTTLKCEKGQSPYQTTKVDSKVRKVFEAHGIKQ